MCLTLTDSYWQHEKKVQVSRHIRQLPVQDLLVCFSWIPARGITATGEIYDCHLHKLSEQEQRSIQLSNCWEPRLGSAQRPAAEHFPWVSVLREVARLLWSWACSWFARNAGAHLQQEQPQHGWLRVAVLWPRTQHPQTGTQRTVSLPLPLVLLRALWGVQGYGMG